MPRTIAILQARMGSTRLPGKTLMDLGGETMLARIVRRTQRARLVDHVVVATTVLPEDDAICSECKRLNVAVSRGSVDDVLERYYHAAQMYQAEWIVRITCDNPLVDPNLIDQVVAAFQTKGCDYASNGQTPFLPHGLGVEVMKFSALERAYREACEFYERVHVTPYIYQNPKLFHLVDVRTPTTLAQYRWTVDTIDDLALIRTLYQRLGHRDDFSWVEAAALMEQDSALEKMNLHIEQKKLEQG